MHVSKSQKAYLVICYIVSCLDFAWLSERSQIHASEFGPGYSNTRLREMVSGKKAHPLSQG